MTTRIPVPYRIRRVDEGRQIEIQWDQEGHVALFSSRDLRLACPCAACVEEMTGRRMLNPAAVPTDVLARTVRLVGAYAAHFEWSDGHSTGIYPWERLFARCPCPECTAARSQS